MMRIIESTDRKHLGEIIDEAAAVIMFEDGGTMAVELRRVNPDGTVTLHNSNYTLRVEAL